MTAYPTPAQVTAMTLPELRTLAGTLGITGASKLNKVTVTGKVTAAIAAAKEAAKEARAKAAAAKEEAKAAAAAQAETDAAAITAIESEMAVTRAAAEVNLETLATEFTRVYPYCPWQVRGYGTDAAAVTRYFTEQGVSKEEDTLTFPAVIRQAVAVVIWAGTNMSDTVPAKVREMALRMMGVTDDTTTVAPVNADAPVTHVVAMTGSSQPTIARDRTALGLASETRSAANTGKHGAGSDEEGDGSGDSASQAAPAGARVTSIPEMLASMDLDELEMLVTLATEEIANRKADMDSQAA